jgi:mono/diheme cytochrome c family protein
MRILSVLISTLLLIGGAFLVAQETGDSDVARGRYLIQIAGCNDCHTEGFIPAAGQLPESEWLTGSSLGFRGPWGTTYASNLRITMAAFTEDEWVETARAVEYLPPMPWWALREMTDEDLSAIYRFVRSLGEPGEAAPAYLPPDKEPPPPYVTSPAPPAD